MKTEFKNNAIFWVEVDKIKPNPYQPRREFNEESLKDLADSIRMYGVLQPLTVTRKENHHDSGIVVEYELIAGERRLRASKLAGIVQVPVIIRSGPEDAKIKLELAIIENLQREDLNPIDRAKAFQQLTDEFDFSHIQIAKKVGKSREYVSNSIRLLNLPDDIQSGIIQGKISEGHARPLGMLRDKPDEQANVFKEIVLKKLTVREAEKIARSIAKDKVRKKTVTLPPKMVKMQKQLSETLGTRVHIEPKEVGGKLVIDYFSAEDVEHIVDLVNASLLNNKPGMHAAMERYEKKLEESQGTINSENNSENELSVDSVEQTVKNDDLNSDQEVMSQSSNEINEDSQDFDSALANPIIDSKPQDEIDNSSKDLDADQSTEQDSDFTLDPPTSSDTEDLKPFNLPVTESTDDADSSIDEPFFTAPNEEVKIDALETDQKSTDQIDQNDPADVVNTETDKEKQSEDNENDLYGLGNFSV